MTASMFYATLDIPFLDEGILTRLREHAMLTISESSYHTHEWSDYDHLRFCDPLIAVPELTLLTDDCMVKASLGIFMLPPQITMPIHQDNVYTNSRLSTIAVPLYPMVAYPPTYWYDDQDAVEPIAAADWADMRPKLLNIDHWHGGISTGDSWRCTLQISLVSTYEHAYGLIKENRLFRTHACRAID